jgi:hypothetical protein
MQTLVFEKLTSYKKLISKYDDFKNLILQYKGNLDPEKCQIDFKIHKMAKNDVPCRLIWHYDGTNRPHQSPVVDHCLFLTGDALSNTLFFKHEPRWMDGTEQEIHQYAKESMKNHPVNPIDFGIWNHYTSHNLHTATKSKTTGTRILIRLKNII